MVVLLRVTAIPVILLMLAACGNVVVSTFTEVATASPSATQAPTPTGGLSGLRADGIAEVVTNDLVVRSLPEISDRSTIEPVYLQDGQLLFVLDGPASADGYQWYRVAPFDRCPTCTNTPVAEPPPLVGWVADGSKDGEAWIAPFSEPCTDPQRDPGSWRPGLIALACYGDGELVVEGTLGGCAGVVTGFVEPSWLAEGGCQVVLPGVDPHEGGEVIFHHPPEGLPMGAGTRIRVVGHLDDAAALGCKQTSRAWEAGQEPIPPAIVILRCRGGFVATEITVIP